MSSSYKRRCKKCGRLIQLRRMPGGQWVAWEGYDSVHDCKKPVPKQAYHSENRVAGDSAGYGDIELDDISISAGIVRDSGDNSYHKADEYPAKRTSKRQNIRNVLDLAIAQKKVVRIEYRKKYAGLISRDFEPIRRTDSTCYGYCRLRHAFRELKIPSMRAISALSENFSPRYEAPTPVGYDSAPPSSYPFPSTNYKKSIFSDISFRQILGWIWPLFILFLLVKSCVKSN